ncbi:MAG: hypothetical protein ACOX3T_05405 [Bdellovibrionota bacterium]
MKNYFINKNYKLRVVVTIFFIFFFIASPLYAEFDDFSDAVPKGASVENLNKYNTNTNINTTTNTATTNINANTNVNKPTNSNVNDASNTFSNTNKPTSDTTNTLNQSGANKPTTTTNNNNNNNKPSRKITRQEAIAEINSQLNNVKQATMLLNVIGINNYGNFINHIGGVQNILSTINSFGGVNSFASVVNSLQGFKNFQSLINQVNGISNLAQFINGPNIGGVRNFISLIRSLGGGGNLQSLLGDIGGLGSLNSLIGNLGGIGSFQSILSALGGFGNFSSLISGIGFGNLANFISGIGGIENLANFAGIVTSLFGGFGSNLFQSFLANLNLLGSLGNIPSISSILSQFGFANLLDFMNWAERYLRFFGISLGSIASDCENSNSVLTCASQAMVNGTMNLFGAAGGEYTCNGGVCSRNNTMKQASKCQGGYCPTTQNFDNFDKNLKFFPKEIRLDPNLKKKTKLTKSNDIAINQKDNKRDEIMQDIASQLRGSEREETFKAVKEQIDKYVDTSAKETSSKDRKLPFAIGNEKASEMRSKEEAIALAGDFKMCNKKIASDRLDINMLTAPQLNYKENVSCKDGTGIYLSSAKNVSKGSYFEHRAYNRLQGRLSDFIGDPEGILTGCYEIHKVKPQYYNILRPVGRCRMTFNLKGTKIGVPSKFKEQIWLPFVGCALGCKKWTIISEKVEYYYPTHKITLSQDPLYSRYLEKNTAEKMLAKYKNAVKTELETATSSKELSQTLLESVSKSEKRGSEAKFKGKSDMEIQATKGVPETAFLGQIQHGYMRIFPFDAAEEKMANNVWRNSYIASSKQALPHVSANKSYWGTDFSGESDKFFTPNHTSKDKENLQFYLNYAGNEKQQILRNKHLEHINIPWNTVRRDGLTGGSYIYVTDQKTDPILHEKGALPDEELNQLNQHNTPIRNKNAFGVGNISSLNNLTPTGNSDYITQTLIRGFNMFLAEKSPIKTLTFEHEDKAKPLLGTGMGEVGFCKPLVGTDDPQMLPYKYLNHAVVKTIVGDTFYQTTLAPITKRNPMIRGERQTFKLKYDLLHAPVLEEDNGEKYPKSFNEDFNKDVQNILNKKLKKDELNVDEIKGDTCYALFEATNNNLDFNMVNTLTNKYKNVSTLANKGEISFTLYTLFSGTIAFPGMTCHTWYHGVGVTPRPQAGHCYDMFGGSKATPKIRNDEFRLF